MSIFSLQLISHLVVTVLYLVLLSVFYLQFFVRAQLLFCSLSLLFSDVPIPVAFVVP